MKRDSIKTIGLKLLLVLGLPLMMLIQVTAEPVEAGWPTREFSLTVDVSSEGGVVIINNVTPSSYPHTVDLDFGSTVSIEVVPSFGYVFNGWSGDLHGTVSDFTLIVTGNKDITAAFSVDLATVGWTLGIFIITGIIAAVLVNKIKDKPIT